MDLEQRRWWASTCGSGFGSPLASYPAVPLEQVECRVEVDGMREPGLVRPLGIAPGEGVDPGAFEPVEQDASVAEGQDRRP